MRNNLFETIVGTFVLICAIYFFVFSFQKSGVSNKDSYQLIAEFEDIGDLSNGGDVKISGVKIGTIDSQTLNPENYRAVLKLNINKDIKLSSDSSAKIVSSGLLGGKFISIEPGADEELLKNGDLISFTQSSVNFEELLGKFIFGSKKDDQNKQQK